LYVRLRLNPRNDPELDDYYWEFEEDHPGYARYSRWSTITFSAAVIAALLLFIAAYV